MGTLSRWHPVGSESLAILEPTPLTPNPTGGHPPHVSTCGGCLWMHVENTDLQKSQPGFFLACVPPYGGGGLSEFLVGWVSNPPPPALAG